MRSLFSNSLLIGNDWISEFEFAFGEIILQVLEADFDVKFSTSSYNVLTRLFGVALDKWIRLGKLSQTFNELWKICSVLGLDGNANNC